jgi:hypothetical protein
MRCLVIECGPFRYEQWVSHSTTLRERPNSSKGHIPYRARPLILDSFALIKAAETFTGVELRRRITKFNLR